MLAKINVSRVCYDISLYSFDPVGHKILLDLLSFFTGAAGFTAAGVAGGSTAAAAQGSIYGAWTTGVFSVLQSAGAIFFFFFVT